MPYKTFWGTTKKCEKKKKKKKKIKLIFILIQFSEMHGAGRVSIIDWRYFVISDIN